MGIARLHHRRVVTGKLNVAVVVYAFHLVSAEAVLVQVARIGAGGHPVLYCLIGGVVAIKK
ncbi:hypothetical protein D3C71_1635310 [compost metagenome]